MSLDMPLHTCDLSQRTLHEASAQEQNDAVILSIQAMYCAYAQRLTYGTATAGEVSQLLQAVYNGLWQHQPPLRARAVSRPCSHSAGAAARLALQLHRLSQNDQPSQSAR